MENKILWKSQRKIIGRNFISAMIYFPLGFVLIWAAWFIAVPKSLWWIIAALPLTWSVMNDLKIFLNFKTMFLDIKGLTLDTNFNGKKFYPYGTFLLVASESGIGPFDFQESLELISIDKKHIRFSALRGKEIMDGFENAAKFIEFCTKYSNEALKTMDIQTKMKLYELYNDKQLLFRIQIYGVKRIFELDFDVYVEDEKGIK